MVKKLSISIITPTFNRADELDFLLRSISKQTYPLTNIECIISDDGSHDNTPAIASKFPQFHFVDLGTNRGLSAARNAGIRKAKGSIIAFTDAD